MKTSLYNHELANVLYAAGFGPPEALYSDPSFQKKLRDYVASKSVLCPVECFKPWFFDNHSISYLNIPLQTGPYSAYSAPFEHSGEIKAKVRLEMAFPAHNLCVRPTWVGSEFYNYASIALNEKPYATEYAVNKLTAAVTSSVSGRILDLRDSGYIRFFDTSLLGPVLVFV